MGYSQAFTQINNEVESNDFSHAISIGWSNPISSISTLFDSKNEEKFGILIDYQMNISENNFYRVHSKFSPSYKNPMLSLNNFLISISKGKWLFEKRNTNIGHGIGPYFRCNIYRGQAVAGTQAFWSSDYFGTGLEYFMFLEYLIKKDLFINVVANFNIGFHQYYEATIVNSSGGSAALSQEYWGLRLANQQLISIAIKKYL
ncbi:MAG: hypothetical protein L7S72_03545 [Flavobacteriales bacterium]|nr:hypothetical protein [Flavobacteriales bacterium]